jgi:hypothetical protein
MKDRESDLGVSTAVAREFADQHDLLFFEASAKNCTNVEEAFMALAKELLYNLRETVPLQDALSPVRFPSSQVILPY